MRSAHGDLQVRFRVYLTIILGGKKIRGTFTLADRSKNKYPALIGCKILNKKFLIDVSKGFIRENRSDDLTQELKRDPKAFFEKYRRFDQIHGRTQPVEITPGVGHHPVFRHLQHGSLDRTSVV